MPYPSKATIEDLATGPRGGSTRPNRHFSAAVSQLRAHEPSNSMAALPEAI